jgi:flagellar hook-associated protein 3 FlgL
MTRVDNMSKLNETNKNTLTNIVGNIQNVDMVKLGVQLNTEQNAFQASLSATAKLVQMSLLDYL